MKRRKFQSLMVAVFAAWLGVMGYQTKPPAENRSMDAWVEPFMRGDYASAGAYIGEEAICLAYLDALRGSISKIDVVGDTIQVACVRHKPITGVSVDEVKLQSLAQDYIDEKIVEDEFRSALEGMYLEAFNRALGEPDGEASLVVSADTDCMEFVRKLSEAEGITANVAVYASEVKSEFNVALRGME